MHNKAPAYYGGRVWRTPPPAAGRDSLAPTLMAPPLPPVSSMLRVILRAIRAGDLQSKCAIFNRVFSPRVFSWCAVLCTVSSVKNTLPTTWTSLAASVSSTTSDYQRRCQRHCAVSHGVLKKGSSSLRLAAGRPHTSLAARLVWEFSARVPMSLNQDAGGCIQMFSKINHFTTSNLALVAEV